jgi:riboflavin kinase/FMN adenylyltransferase
VRRFIGLEGVTPGAFHSPVVTIGVFDGMHRGHRHLIEELRARADRLGGDAVVITFDTHPLAVIRGEPPRQILSVPHRLLLLERHGVDATLLLPFDETTRRMDYARFTKEVLVDRIGIRALLFGYNSNFGLDGRGTPETLRPVGERWGFEVAEAPPITLHGRPVSSTRIRDAIESGDLASASEMLGRPYAVYGRVVKGDGRGKSLGFPTANVDPEGEILPPPGVWQVVAEVRGQRRSAVANLGTRPTFTAGREAAARVLEVHVPGIDFDFYGDRIEVEFVHKLREERTFPSKEALLAQIRADVASLGGGS